MNTFDTISINLPPYSETEVKPKVKSIVKNSTM